MINYIFEIMAFIAATVAYVKGDMYSMTVWLSAAIILGAIATFGEYIYKKFKEVKFNG